MGYENDEAVLMVQIVGECGNNFSAAERLWRERFPDRTPHSRRVFERLIKRLINKGIVQPDHNKGKVIRRPVRDVRSVDILASVQVNPRDSLNGRARDSGVSKTTIHRILKAEKCHPYRMTLRHALMEGDFQLRLDFCNWAIDQDPLFHRKLMFSDECTFKSDAEVNTWNCRYWSDQNPHWFEQIDHQHVWKVNVWCGILKNKIVGPIFLDENLNGARYAAWVRYNLRKNYLCQNNL